MRKLPCILLLVFSAVGATAVSADVARNDARMLLERSGIAEQIRSSGAGLQARLEEFLGDQGKGIPQRWLDQMEAMFRSLIDPPRIVELLERGLAEELSRSDLVSLNDFYESPLARRLVAAEISASTLAAWDRIDASVDALEARLDRNPVREDLLGRLDRARRYSEIVAALAAANFAGFMQGAMAAVGKKPETSYEVEFAVSRILFLQRFRYDNAILLIYTYGPITNEEIEQYLAFLHTPAARTFYDTVESVQRQYYLDAGARFAEAAADLVSELIGKTPTTVEETPTVVDETPTPADEATAGDEKSPRAEVTRKAARELLERSGATQLITGYAADRERNAATLPYALNFESVHPDLMDAFVGVFRQGVQPELVIDLAEHGLSDSLSHDDLDALNEFYTSPLGERIVALEAGATTQQAMNRVREEKEELAARLEDNPVRRKLLGELDKDLRKSEADVSLVAAVYTGIGKASDRPADRGSSFDDVFETARRDFIEGVRAQEILFLEYTYGPLADDEILEYLRFLKTDPARKYHIYLESALTVYFGESGKTFAEAFKKAWGEQEAEAQ